MRLTPTASIGHIHTTPVRDAHRRRMLQLAMIAGGAMWAGRAMAATLVATPTNALGPFYPDTKPADTDADLTVVAGRSQRAAGTPLYVSGQVLDMRGRPLAAADIEVWQANAFGRYHHPRDGDSSGALDPNFQGYGRLTTDSEGRYRLKTIKPPPYSGRTAHIHFNVASARTQLTTQMFFDGDKGNERDFLYRNLGADERRASTGRWADRGTGMESDAVVAVWDIVLRT